MTRAAQEELNRRLARKYLEGFTLYTKSDYQVNWHHRIYFKKLRDFLCGKIRRLMIFAPARTGKSEIVSRRLPAFAFGLNPNVRIIACSHTASLASAMNRDVQRIIDSPEYSRIFPETTLFSRNVKTLSRQGHYLRNSEIFEIVGHNGYYLSAGVGGAITGVVSTLVSLTIR